jgi:hypothetical protein
MPARIFAAQDGEAWHAVVHGSCLTAYKADWRCAECVSAAHELQRTLALCGSSELRLGRALQLNIVFPERIAVDEERARELKKADERAKLRRLHRFSAEEEEEQEDEEVSAEAVQCVWC